MKHILLILKKYTIGIIITVFLLAFQAYCDLRLPEYTSDIINIGIQQKGIDSNIPEALCENTYTSYNAILEGLLDDYYMRIEPGNELYKDKIPYANNKVIYVVKDLNKKQLEELSNLLVKPEVFYLMVSTSDVISTNQYGLDGITLSHILENIEDHPVKTLLAKVDTIDEYMLKQYSITAVESEYKKIGIDLEEKQMSYLIKSCIKMLLLAIVITLDLIVACNLSARIAAGAAADLRSLIVNKVMSYSNSEFNKFSTSSLITRSTNDISQLQVMLTMTLRMVLYAPIVGIGALIKVAHIDMAWVIGIAIGIITLLIIILLIIGLPKFKIIQKLIDRINLVVREELNGLPVIRAFANEKKEIEKFEKANSDLLKTNLFINKMMALTGPVMSLIMNGTIIAVYWVSANKIDQGLMQVGTLTALVTYTFHIIISFLILSMVSVMAPRSLISLGRIKEVLNLDSSILNKENTKKLDENKKGELEFRDVSFKYPDGEELVLENISFKVKKGSTTAIIGSTGCGKSTIVNLIPRFFDITSGSILVDGVDVRDANIEDLRDRIGLVPQKGLLFSGTIKSNIKFANSNMSDEDMIKASEVACASEFINKLDEKYDYDISQGGTNVSGGQRQRLAIARAVAKNPEIFIFDDSFSALDYKTDSIVRKNLSKYCKDATKIIIAQRVGTVMNADQIIVLEDGKIVGIGTHKELYKNCKVYKEIALSQLREEELKNA